MQYKSISIELSDVDTKKGIVLGYGSTTGILDDVGDIVEPGAFTKTITENGPGAKDRIRHLYMHNPFYILGKPLVLREDEKGLYFETQFTDTSYGKDVLKLYESGVINEHSIGYEVIRDKTKYEKSADPRFAKIRRIGELRLFEYSSVIFGANPDTPTIGVKSLDNSSSIEQLSKQIASIESALKHGHLSTDEICQQLEIALKQIKDSITALTIEPEPTEEVTPAVDEPQEGFQELLSIRDALNSIL